VDNKYIDFSPYHGNLHRMVFDVTNVVAVFHRQHCYCLPSLDFRFREHEASPKIFDEKEKYLKVFLREGNKKNIYKCFFVIQNVRPTGSQRSSRLYAGANSFVKHKWASLGKDKPPFQSTGEEKAFDCQI